MYSLGILDYCSITCAVVKHLFKHTATKMIKNTLKTVQIMAKIKVFYFDTMYFVTQATKNAAFVQNDTIINVHNFLYK